MEENNPLVSVCMPAFNAEKYIFDAVKSILNQTYTNIELLIVNDGSIDNTKSILDGIKDSRVKIFYTENKGQCAAANFAFQNSSGQYIKFMDADDLISSSFIANQVNKIIGTENKIVSARWGRFYNDNLDTFRINENETYLNLNPDQWLLRSWKNAEAMMQCAIWLIPRNILAKSGLWDEALSLINDLDFFTRVVLNSEEVLFEENAILYYRSGNVQSLSASKERIAILSAYKSIDKATNYFHDRFPTPAVKLTCANVWQQFIFSYFPKHQDLIALAQQKINEFGGASLKFNAGGLTLKLSQILGWKTAVYIKNILKQA